MTRVSKGVSVRLPFLACLGLLSTLAVAQVDRGAPLPRKVALGAQLADATPEEAKSAGVDRAVKIAGVLPGLTAEGMALKAGDLIVEFAGQRVATRGSLVGLVRTFEPGKKVTAKVMRDGKVVTLEGTSIGRPKQKEDGFKVVYDQVVSQGKRIRVIATHPDGTGPFPTIMLIGGIGAYSVDGDFPSVLYGNVMGPLAKAGFATVRIDKPGQGDSEGPPYPELLFDVELDAYVQALRLAKTLPFVDKSRIALFGHSMGGCFAPLVAADEPVAGVAVSGTLSKTWYEYWLENTRRQSLLAGASAADVDDEIRRLAPVTHHLFSQGLSIAEIVEKFPQDKGMAQAMSPDGKTLSGVGIPFFQQLANKNLPRAWSKTQSKVLVVYCANDFLSGQADHEFIAELVNKERPGTAQFKLLPDSDHGFNQTSSMKDSMDRWGRPGAAFNPSIVDTLRAWLADSLSGN